jgi:histidinol-phosphate aminotransferase
MKINPKLLNNIRQVTPYIPGEQKSNTKIKLNTNESPYPPSPAVIKAIQELSEEGLRLYPDPDSKELKKALADYHQVDSDQIFVGVGSDEVLALCFLTFFNSKHPILFPDITYSFYKVWADLYNIPYQQQTLNENFKLIKFDYYKANGGIIFPNPNAPTGIYEDLEFVEGILIENPNVIVVVDEAYIDFVDDSTTSEISACDLIDRYDNLVVVQTFSKSRSMAGLRVGYALSNPQLIKYLENVKNSFNSYTMNLVSHRAAVASVMDNDYFRDNIKKVISLRTWFIDQVKEIGFDSTDSKGNFVFIKHQSKSAKFIFEELRGQGIYLRHWNDERIKDYLRITIGTKEELEALLIALKALV